LERAGLSLTILDECSASDFMPPLAQLPRLSKALPLGSRGSDTPIIQSEGSIGWQTEQQTVWGEDIEQHKVNYFKPASDKLGRPAGIIVASILKGFEEANGNSNLMYKLANGSIPVTLHNDQLEIATETLLDAPRKPGPAKANPNINYDTDHFAACKLFFGKVLQNEKPCKQLSHAACKGARSRIKLYLGAGRSLKSTNYQDLMLRKLTHEFIPQFPAFSDIPGHYCAASGLVANTPFSPVEEEKYCDACLGLLTKFFSSKKKPQSLDWEEKVISSRLLRFAVTAYNHLLMEDVESSRFKFSHWVELDAKLIGKHTQMLVYSYPDSVTGFDRPGDPWATAITNADFDTRRKSYCKFVLPKCF